MIRDNSYSTVRYGYVPSFSGAQLTRDGDEYVLTVGQRAIGTAGVLRAPGEIRTLREFAPRAPDAPPFWYVAAARLWQDGQISARAASAPDLRAAVLVELEQ
jgi:hypothetical protein